MFKTPFVLPLIYPDLTWKIKTKEKVIYLTFDDGPIPEITEFVLKTLKEYNTQATFFCIGENIQKHPDIFKKLVEGNHSIGNHTHNHLNGWKTEIDTYVDNVWQCDEILKQHGVETQLFRPPYGRIKKSQIKTLTTNYKLVMWDILTKDYNRSVNKETSLQRCIKQTEPGSIVVFHDSIKAAHNMQYILPRYLSYFTSLGYKFDKLPMVW